MENQPQIDLGEEIIQRLKEIKLILETKNLENKDRKKFPVTYPDRN
jgi:hypothetical protein